MDIVDIRADLPRVPDNDPQPLTQVKTDWILHYQGNDVDRDLSDEDAKDLALRDAKEHIARDWDSQYPGVQGGGGLMYHYMIAPSGTVFKTRDETDYLWNCGNDKGNRCGVAVQVQCGPNTPPTDAQLFSLTLLIATHPEFNVTGNRDWSSTQCPGERLYAYITGKEYEMNYEAFMKWFLQACEPCLLLRLHTYAP